MRSNHATMQHSLALARAILMAREDVSSRGRARLACRTIGRIWGWVIGVFLSACVLSGCDQQAMIEQVPPEDLDFAKQYVALFQRSDFAAIEEASNPGMRTAQFRPTLMLMATMIPAEAPASIEVVGAEVANSGENSRSTSLRIQYEFSAAWLLVDLVVSRANGTALVDSIYFTPLATSWKDMNAFTLGGKPLLSYLLLGFSILVVPFMIASLIFCLVTPIPKRKWLWCILIFVGVGSLGLNWTTGEVDFQMFYIGINVGFGRLGIGGPYYIQTCFPVGATMFWIRRRAWMRDHANGPSRIADRF